MNHDPEWTMARVNAMTIPCSYCRVLADEVCVNPATGYELEFQPAHMLRLVEAHVL